MESDTGLRSGVARNPPFPLSGDWQEEAHTGPAGLTEVRLRWRNQKGIKESGSGPA